MDEVVGRQARSPVAGGFDRSGSEEIGRLSGEHQQAGHGGAVRAVLVAYGHPRVAQQVEPGNRRRPSEERLKSVAVEVSHGCGEHRLLVEHVLASSLLKEPGELRRGKVPFRGPDADVVAPARGAMDVEPARDLRQKNAPVFAACRRQQCLADDRPDRWIAVVRRDVEQPLLDHVQSVGRDAGHCSGIVDPEEDRAALGIRERHQLAGQVFGVGRGHPPLAQAQLLEFGAAILPGANLLEHLRGAVEHRLTLPSWRYSAGFTAALRGGNPHRIEHADHMPAIAWPARLRDSPPGRCRPVLEAGRAAPAGTRGVRPRSPTWRGHGGSDRRR